MNYFHFIPDIVFVIGLVICLTRKNAIYILIGIELMLNAAAIQFAISANVFADMSGWMMVLFVVAIAVAETALGIALILNFYSHSKHIDTDTLRSLDDK